MPPSPQGELISRKGAVLERNKFEKMMDEYYLIRGWDVRSGLQKRDPLEARGLSDIVPRLRAKGLLAE